MPDPIHHAQNRGTIESILRKIPGFRGYLEKEYRREADALQREWLAERLQRSKRGVDALARSLADAGQIDVLPQCDKLRARIDKLIGRMRGAMQGYSGFFDLVQVDEDFLDKVYRFDTGMMEQMEAAAASVEKLESDGASGLAAATRQIEDIDREWDKRVDIIKGLL
ncbi:MAG: hypothetical protein AB7O62_07955 [Pirellulales bacterium]